MPSNVKKYIFISLTLGIIAASGALLIAGTNLSTKDRIVANENNSINSGIKNIFNNENAFAKEKNKIEDNAYDYVTVRYLIYENDETPIGYAFRTDGSNNYGKISLIIGFNKEFVYKGLSIIANEQSFASTLKKGYLDVIKGGQKTVDEVDVSCGATYGAKLVKEMVKEAEKAAKDLAGVNNG